MHFVVSKLEQDDLIELNQRRVSCKNSTGDLMTDGRYILANRILNPNRLFASFPNSVVNRTLMITGIEGDSFGGQCPLN